jgi:hypothetical protein
MDIVESGIKHNKSNPQIKGGSTDINLITMTCQGNKNNMLSSALEPNCAL